MKRTLYIAATIFFSITSIGCSNKKDKERIAELEAKIAKLQSEESEKEDILGTYEIYDKILKRSWILTLNPDETATMQLKSGGEILYASWHDFRNGSGHISIEYAVGNVPYMWFPNDRMSSSFNYIKDGYFYNDPSDRDAKNPNGRWPIKKIE